ncbi:MAG: phage antirepressor Ant [Oscillospiraceae bacterium]|nr:MAG: phage antirepressor Ant [Oscillospiraceae bacterium]
MNDMKIFENSEFGAVRVVDMNGEPWFVARDVCECLELGNPRTSIALLDEDEKGVHTMDTPGGAQEMSIVSEAGLYSLILRSRKPEAKAFKRWITHEVLPAIRKHGGYLTPAKLEEALTDPDTIIRLATNLKAEREKRQALEAQAAADRPKVVFAESIEVAKTSILVGEMAKLIKQATGCDMGQNRFFEWLRANGYLHKGGSARNMPTQRCIDAGWMEIKEGTRIGSSGECHITRTPKVTGKGQIYFVNLFREMKAA